MSKNGGSSVWATQGKGSGKPSGNRASSKEMADPMFPKGFTPRTGSSDGKGAKPMAHKEFPEAYRKGRGEGDSGR